ncbi:MAG: hypothetical protein K2M50_01260 [Treponemataceae bacterium]|nr:hypothetical protein [Treponema sp.]MDE6244267.1 hypothetical protein [Treponemataceae bacterium]
MKKLLFAFGALIAALAMTGCLSTPNSQTTLGQDTDDRLFSNETFYGTSLNDTRLVNPKDYAVLGPIIIYEKDGNGIKGYAEILSAAIAKYPETDAVINIVIDGTGSSVDSSGRQTAWSGIAIKITDTIVGNETVQTTKTTDSNGKEVLTETRTTTYKKL